MADRVKTGKQFTDPDGARITRIEKGFLVEGPPAGRRRDENARQLQDELRQAKARLPGLIARLRNLVETYDPIELIGTMSAVSLVSRPGGPDVASEHYGRQAHIEYVAGLALSCGQRSSTPVTARCLDEAHELVEEIFALEEITQANLTEIDPSDSASLAQMWLRVEYLLDRNQGYLSHQRRIFEAVFGPIDDRCKEELGFSPLTLPPIALACNAMASHRLREAGRGAGRKPGSPPVDLRGIFEYTPEQIAEATELPAAAVETALLALSTSFGQLPEDLSPHQENRVRRFPVIPLGGSSFFFAFFWSPLEEFVPWFLAYARELGKEPLAERFLRARDHAAEQLTRECLARIFAPEAVHGPLEYETEAVETELDCLVDAWPLCLIAEVKAHRATESARRGSPDRVRRFDADLGKARLQADRAANFVRGGGRVFRRPGRGGLVHLQQKPTEIARMAVSFEHIDPLTLRGGLQAADERIWNISLGDLLVVAEILDDPASFSAYLVARSELVTSSNALPFMEGDLLVSFLEGRLVDELEMVAKHPEAQVVSGYSAGPLNEYFGGRDFGISVKKPTTGVPAEVLQGVRRLMQEKNSEWHRIALAVMAADKVEWKAWKKLTRKVRRRSGGSRATRQFSFQLSSGLEIVLLVSDDNDCFDRLAEAAAGDPGALALAIKQGAPQSPQAAASPPR